MDHPTKDRMNQLPSRTQPPRTRRNRWLFVFLVLAIIVSILLVSAIFLAPESIHEKESIFYAPEETQFIFILIALAFLLAVGLLISAVARRNRELDLEIKEMKKKVPAPAEMTVVGATDMPAPVCREEKKKEDGPRFFMLNELDAKYAKAKPAVFTKNVSLAEVAERFRLFAASRLGLYYSIEDIRRFIAGLTVSRIIIMQGMSGTGKTSLAYAFGEFIKNSAAIVPIQPMWKERTDMLGYYNEFTRRFNETTLLREMYEANYREDMFIVVLDEMNIARVEYYFAEFLSLLEIPDPERRYIDVVSDVREDDPRLLREGRLKLPKNMWFIGTANNDDSTFAISDKVYDRSMIINLDRKSEVFDAPETEGMPLSADDFDEWAKKARRANRMTWRNRRRLRVLDSYMTEKFHVTFGNRIMKQIEQYVPAYVACGGDELEALDDILAKKLFRKLESRNPIFVRNGIEGLCLFLDDLFGKDHMTISKTYLHQFERSA